jgi:hypothetical protein
VPVAPTRKKAAPEKKRVHSRLGRRSGVEGACTLTASWASLRTTTVSTLSSGSCLHAGLQPVQRRRRVQRQRPARWHWLVISSSTWRSCSACGVLKTAAAMSSSGKPTSLPRARPAPISEQSSASGSYGLAKTSVEPAAGRMLKVKAKLAVSRAEPEALTPAATTTGSSSDLQRTATSGVAAECRCESSWG